MWRNKSIPCKLCQSGIRKSQVATINRLVALRLFFTILKNTLYVCKPHGENLNIKMSPYQYRDPHVKDKTVDCLIFRMGIPIPGKDGFHVEMGPRNLLYYHFRSIHNRSSQQIWSSWHNETELLCCTASRYDFPWWRTREPGKGNLFLEGSIPNNQYQTLHRITLWPCVQTNDNHHNASNHLNLLRL